MNEPQTEIYIKRYQNKISENWKSWKKIQKNDVSLIGELLL